MKFIFFSLLLSISLNTFCQGACNSTLLPKDDKGVVCYSEVIEVPGTSKNTLFIKANEWFAKSFNSANDVIQMNDKDSGKIIGKGRVVAYIKTMGMDAPTKASFTIEFNAKDNKYRYAITNIIMDGGYQFQEKTQMGSQKLWDKCIVALDQSFKNTIEDLKASIVSTSDNW